MPTLDQAFQAATTYSSLSETDISGVLAKFAGVAMTGKCGRLQTQKSEDLKESMRAKT